MQKQLISKRRHFTTFPTQMKSSVYGAEKWGCGAALPTFCIKVRNTPENRDLIAYLFDEAEPAVVYYHAGKTPLAFQWTLDVEAYADLWRAKSTKPRFN